MATPQALLFKPPPHLNVCSLSTTPQAHENTPLSTQQAGTDSRMKLRVKGFSLMLLLVLLALCSTIDVCDAARRGKHWRPRTSPSSSMLKRKGKAKKGSSSHRQHGGSRPSPRQPVSPPPYQPSPNAPVSPSPQPSPAKGNGHPSPKPPPPSCGKGNQPPPQPPPAATSGGTVFSVVDFGAKGDGVSDDTKVSVFFLEGRM
jgi:hypothetical protein